MSWSGSFLQGWKADTDVSGPGTIKNFLSRQAYGAGGGVIAEMIHDWAVEEHGKGKSGVLGMLEEVGEETVTLVVIVFAAYSLESVWKDQRAKLVSAGMAGRYGSETFDWVKSHVPGLSSSDKGSRAQGLTMDNDPVVMKEVAQAIKNSPQTIDHLSRMMARTLTKEGGAAEGKDADKLAKELADQFKNLD